MSFWLSGIVFSYIIKHTMGTGNRSKHNWFGSDIELITLSTLKYALIFLLYKCLCFIRTNYVVHFLLNQNYGRTFTLTLFIYKLMMIMYYLKSHWFWFKATVHIFLVLNSPFSCVFQERDPILKAANVHPISTPWLSRYARSSENTPYILFMDIFLIPIVILFNTCIYVTSMKSFIILCIREILWIFKVIPCYISWLSFSWHKKY